MKAKALILLAILVAGSRLCGAVLTNADIIKMAEANLNESIILSSIENSEPGFDTSPQGLIELSAAKVSPTLISAMITRASAPAQPAASASEAATEEAPAVEPMSPSEVFIIDDGEPRGMRYLNPQMRTAARALGMGGVASYAVLRGHAANERISDPQPSFLVSVPNQSQVESYVTVASFAVRKNNSREVLVGGGYMSYSSGIHPDRVMAISTERAEDQSRAHKGFTIYKITPSRPLKTGEYAVIVYSSEMQSLVGAWFTGTGNSYFDFGVDP
ncbi:MAG TPA: hypothetical protein VIK52_06585 [Opitutaceae bacterium]